MEHQLLVTDVSGQTWSHLPGWSRKPLKMGLTGCPKMSVTYYKSAPCNIPVEKRAHLHGSRSLNSQMYLSLVHHSPLFSESFLLVFGYKIMKIMHISSYSYYCNVKLKVWCNINHCHEHNSCSSDNGLEGSNWTEEKTVNKEDAYSAHFPKYYLGNHNDNEID
jgi:hypothetical protein